MGQVGVFFHLCCLVSLTSGFFLDAVLPRPITPAFPLHISLSCCLMQDERSYPLKGSASKLVARKSLVYV